MYSSFPKSPAVSEVQVIQQLSNYKYWYDVINSIEFIIILNTHTQSFVWSVNGTLNKTLFYRCINWASDEMAVEEHNIEVSTVTFDHRKIKLKL